VHTWLEGPASPTTKITRSCVCQRRAVRVGFACRKVLFGCAGHFLGPSQLREHARANTQRHTWRAGMLTTLLGPSSADNERRASALSLRTRRPSLDGNTSANTDKTVKPKRVVALLVIMAVAPGLRHSSSHGAGSYKTIRGSAALPSVGDPLQLKSAGLRTLQTDTAAAPTATSINPAAGASAPQDLGSIATVAPLSLLTALCV
jgi:hypothetical protein